MKRLENSGCNTSIASYIPINEASNMACLRITTNCTAKAIIVGPGFPANIGGTSSIAQQKTSHFHWIGMLPLVTWTYTIHICSLHSYFIYMYFVIIIGIHNLSYPFDQ